MAQKFIENVFEKHIDWVALIQNDDNYKNILQVKNTKGIQGYTTLFRNFK